MFRSARTASVAATVLLTQLLYRHAHFDLPQESDDLPFRVLALACIRHSPKLTETYGNIIGVLWGGQGARLNECV